MLPQMLFAVIVAALCWLIAPEALPLVGFAVVTPVVDATAWAEKMLRNVRNAAQDWERGVQNPSASPVGAMRRSAGRYRTAVETALREDRWGRAIAGLTDEAIIAQALRVGGGAFVAGVTARQDKITAAIARLQPLVQALKQRIDAMPADTDEQREQRMLAATRGMRDIGRQLAGLTTAAGR